MIENHPLSVPPPDPTACLLVTTVVSLICMLPQNPRKHLVDCQFIGPPSRGSIILSPKLFIFVSLGRIRGYLPIWGCVPWESRYSNLFYSDTVSVVPRRHDEYPRFISAAWPYYAGAISTSVGFIVFSVIYLGGEVDRKAKGKSKSTKTE